MIAWRYEPARDLGFKLQQRLCSYSRETDLTESALRFSWGVAVREFLRCWNRFEVHGKGHLPAQPPFVLVANHASHLDALVLASALPLAWRDRVYPIAAGDYFFNSGPRIWFAAAVLNALPVWRERHFGHAHALRELRGRLLSDRSVYILFPEGTRSRDGQIHAFKPGLGHLVAGTSVPVVPCYVQGTAQALAPGQIAVHPAAVTLHIGAARQFPNTPDEPGGWREIAAVLQAEVKRLENTSSRRQTDMSGNIRTDERMRDAASNRCQVNRTV